MTNEQLKRKLVSVTFSPQEWEFIEKANPPYTKFGKMFKDLILKHFEYPPLDKKDYEGQCQ